jgi:hypothetical protein
MTGFASFVLHRRSQREQRVSVFRFGGSRWTVISRERGSIANRKATSKHA